jgi:chitinase
LVKNDLKTITFQKNKMNLFCFIFLLLLLLQCGQAQTKPTHKIAVISYYSGNAESVNDYAAEKLTHIIFRFCYLKGNKFQ